MEYYIVMNEWKYPDDSGREFIGDFDSCLDAEYASKSECAKELDSFDAAFGDHEILKGFDSYSEPIGYSLKSSLKEFNEFYFKSSIIKREL